MSHTPLYACGQVMMSHSPGYLLTALRALQSIICFTKQCFHSDMCCSGHADEERIGAKRKKKMQHFNNFFGDGGAGGPGSMGGGGGGGANFFKGVSIFPLLLYSL